jgi:hypothetical protein
LLTYLKDSTKLIVEPAVKIGVLEGEGVRVEGEGREEKSIITTPTVFVHTF